MTSEFPDFIRALPPPDAPVQLTAHLAVGDEILTMFYEAPELDVVVPEHRHGDQWGIVLDGEVEMTIGGEVITFGPGETYFVPAGIPHLARVKGGTRGIDIFADRDRYTPLMAR